MRKNRSVPPSPENAPTIFPFEVLADFSGKAIVAEICDEPNVATSLSLMFPGSELSDLSHMSVDEVLRRARKEIFGCLVSSDRAVVVGLSLGMRAYCVTLDEASEVCRKFAQTHGIGEAEWLGGTVTFLTCADAPAATIDSRGEIIMPAPSPLNHSDARRKAQSGRRLPD